MSESKILQGGGLLFLIVAAFVPGVWQQSSPQNAQLSDMTSVLGLLCVGIMLVYRWQMPCQKCRKALGWSALIWRPAAHAFDSPLCPNCGTSIDHDVNDDSNVIKQ
jgi:hypothetical protein